MESRHLNLSTAYAIGGIVTICLLGCSKQLGPAAPVDNPPTISQFTAFPQTIREGGTVQFTIAAADDHDVARAILDYGDPSYKNPDGSPKRDTLQLSGTSVTTNASHQYSTQGSYVATGTVFDNAGQQASKATPITINLFNPPQIIVAYLSGFESKISKALISGMAADSQGDLFTLSFTPLNSDLIVQVAADTLRYSLVDTNASGTRQLRIRADYVKYGTPSFVQKDIPIIFTPIDDISGTVSDLYLNSYLSTVNPLVVMRGPYSGWVNLVTGADSMRVLIDAAGNFKFPKITNAPHVLHAFMTNGSDSSYIATLNLSAGDQVLNPKVFTNAGTDGSGHMSLGLLFSLYKVINFDIGYAALEIFHGMDLHNHGSEISIYLAGKDTTGLVWSSYGWTSAQQDVLADFIQNNILIYLPLGMRPTIVKGLPTDALPMHIASPFGGPTEVTNDKYVVIFGTHEQPGGVRPWDNNNDGVFESAFVWLGWDNTVTLPPYGIDVATTNQEVGSSFVGDGSPTDPAFKGKSVFFEGVYGNMPYTGADQKLLGLFETQTPGINNHIVQNLFVLPR